MRYLDWDLLLFPSGEGVDGAHVPFKEFKTQCQVEGKHTPETTPLMTAFVPSLPPDTRFQISVHSWSPTVFGHIVPVMEGHVQPRELFEVRVVVDGKLSTIVHLPIDAQWPQIITMATHQNGHTLERSHELRFPPFHEELRNERSWSATDGLGRIRVELSAGFWDDSREAFVKINTIVTFAFQHAPLKMLELAGIAWPSPEMLHHPLPRQGPIQTPIAHGFPGDVFHHTPHMPHGKMPSLSNLQLPGMGPLGLPQQLTGPVNSYQQYDNFDGASRSTSAYSTVSAAAGPLLNNYTHGAGPQQQIGGSQNTGRDSQFQFRLPSDQLAQIITALKPDKREETATSMPPPPLPGHANNSKAESAHLAHYTPTPSGNQRSELDQNAVDAIDRRAASNSGYSDISMHATCNNFPHCITEDPNGCLVHDNTAAPAAVVKGKKEGSSPIKPRDFFSVTLDAAAAGHNPSQAPSQSMTVTPREMMMTNTSPTKEGHVFASSLVSSSPADAMGKKRTRSALKALNLNDGGSPQKPDAANKPARKASRAFASSMKSNENEKEKVSDQFLVEHTDGSENQENIMLDA